MNTKLSLLEQTLERKPHSSDAYQATFNVMYDYQTRSNSSKLLNKSKPLLIEWKKNHDANAPAYEAAHKKGTKVDRFYRRKLLECCPGDNDIGFYDLHYLQRGSAYYFIKTTIQKIRQSAVNPTGLGLIPGKGKHSAGQPVLKAVIEKICRENHIDCHPIFDKDGQWGRLVLTIKPKKPMLIPVSLPEPADKDQEITAGMPSLKQASDEHSIFIPAVVADDHDFEQTSSHMVMTIIKAALDIDDFEQTPANPYQIHAEAALDSAELDQTSANMFMSDIKAAADSDDFAQTPADLCMTEAKAALDSDDFEQTPANPSSTTFGITEPAYSPLLFKPISQQAPCLSPVAKGQKPGQKNPFSFNIDAKEWTPSKTQAVKKAKAVSAQDGAEYAINSTVQALA